MYDAPTEQALTVRRVGELYLLEARCATYRTTLENGPGCLGAAMSSAWNRHTTQQVLELLPTLVRLEYALRVALLPHYSLSCYTCGELEGQRICLILGGCFDEETIH
jgi:hypothetical protein